MLDLALAEKSLSILGASEYRVGDYAGRVNACNIADISMVCIIMYVHRVWQPRWSQPHHPQESRQIINPPPRIRQKKKTKEKETKNEKEKEKEKKKEEREEEEEEEDK